MLVLYAVGLGLVSQAEAFHGSISLTVHFVASVAVSGSLSPRMYIHLKQAYEANAGGASQNLSSFRAASFTASDVSVSLPDRGAETVDIEEWTVRVPQEYREGKNRPRCCPTLVVHSWPAPETSERSHRAR